MSRSNGCCRLLSIWWSHSFRHTTRSSVSVSAAGLLRLDRYSHSWILTKHKELSRERVPSLPTLLLLKRGVKSKMAPSKKKDSPSKTLPPIDPTICNGINILKSGSDPPLRPDTEYPDWLWGLIGGADTPPKPSQFSQDSKEYWRRHNKVKAHKNNELQKQLR